MRVTKWIFVIWIFCVMGGCKHQPASTEQSGSTDAAPRFYSDPNHPTRPELEENAAWNNAHRVPDEVTGWLPGKCGTWTVKAGGNGPYLGFAPAPNMPPDCHTTVNGLGSKEKNP